MIRYTLTDNRLTPDPMDQKAVVVPISTKKMEDVVDMMISRGSTVTKAEALSVLEELFLAVALLVKDGHNVVSPLFNIRLSIKGVFVDTADSFDPSRHTLVVRIKPGPRLKDIVDKAKLEKVSSSKPLPVLLSFKDVTSKTENKTATPGGVAHIAGLALKVNEEDANQGVFFTSKNGTITKVTTIVESNPSKLFFVIPADLAPGAYAVSVRSILPGNKDVREGFLVEDVTVA